MKQIIVAGAGHGGLSAAYNLARNGCRVTVYEKKQRAEMGYDWVDCMGISTFNYVGIPVPDKKDLVPFVAPGFYSPSKKILIAPPDFGPSKTTFYVERRFLINYLIDLALSAGVEIVFGAEATSCVVQGDAVAGIRVILPGETEETEVAGDLVIDAAGMDSPVRKTLPLRFGINHSISEKETFYTYRACYERAGSGSISPVYCNYLYHCGLRGMSWIICTDDEIDILIGQLGGLSQGAVDMALRDFREHYDFIGEKRIRGGSVEKIPLRLPLPVFVADGYALVGDSAAMTEPLSGSGISLSMKAGKLLSDVITERFCEDFSVRNLWRYEYKYFKSFGEHYFGDAITNRMAFSLKKDELESLLASGVVTGKELFGSSDVKPLEDMINKVRGIAGERQLIPKLLRAAASIRKAGEVKKMMPSDYDPPKIAEWRKAYESVF